MLGEGRGRGNPPRRGRVHELVPRRGRWHPDRRRRRRPHIVGLTARRAQALGRSARDLRGLVLTHAHFDHLGFAERARRELSLEVWVHENDVPLSRHPRQYAHERLRAPYFLTQLDALPIVAALLRSRGFWPSPVREVRRYEDGTLPVPGSPRVVFTPADTIGHCALHFPDPTR